MNLDNRYEPLRAAPKPPGRSSPPNLASPYFPKRTTSLPWKKPPHVSEAEERRTSNASTSQAPVQAVQAIEATKSRPQRRYAWERFSHFALDVLPQGWTLEYISCLISVLGFVSIIAVLLEYDQRKLPNWPLGITLNTLLALLTSISQVAFVFPIGSGLSQMKWTWFKGKNRPLEHFEKFDSASRGALGSVILLFCTKGRLSILLASVLLVTAGVTSTVTQAVLTQGTRYVANDQVSTVHRMTQEAKSFGESINQVTGYMISAMYTSNGSTYNFTEPNCQSGNCQWPSFGSLAVCVETNDITDKLIVEETAEQCCTSNSTTNSFNGQDGNWSCANCTQTALAQNKYFSLRALADITLNSTSFLLENGDTWSQLYTFTNESFSHNAMTGAQIIYLNTTDVVGYGAEALNNTALFTKYARAVEAVFYMCVETYSVTTTNGTTTTNITSTVGNVTIYNSYGALSDNEPIFIDNRTFVVDGFNYSYSEIGDDLDQIIQNSLSGSYNSVGDFGLDSMTPFSYALGNALYRSQAINATTGVTRDGLMHDTIDNVLNNIARGMTNWLRTFFASPVKGKTFVSESFVVVRWPFLIFLGTQIILSALFLICVTIDSRKNKVDILKDAAISTLFAISAEDKANFEARFDVLDANSGEREGIEKLSKVTLVYSNPGQWNLKLADAK